MRHAGWGRQNPEDVRVRLHANQKVVQQTVERP